MNITSNIYARIGIAVGSFAVYAALFLLLSPVVGPAALVLTIFPMAAVGWLIGVRGSVLFGIATVPLNYSLFDLAGVPNSSGIAPQLFAGFAFTLTGMMIGWIRNLVTRVNDQAGELRKEHKILQAEVDRRIIVEERLSHEALYDPLTNLPNRRLFVNHLEHALQWVKRHPEDLFAVIYLDFDRFKIINDSLGHDIGDLLLVNMGQRLKSSLRAVDTVARLGGDEFGVLVEAYRNDADVIAMVQGLLERAAAPLAIGENTLVMTASAGIVMNLGRYERLADIMRDADIAMYNAKVSGKNRFRVFDLRMRDEVSEILKLESNLRAALRNGEFRIHYQPILSLKPRVITGFEALLRWQHPKNGLLYPADFIKIAEESGLIMPIGQWVLREACCQMKEWQMQFGIQPPLTISVNVSSQEFAQPDLFQHIEEVLKETGLPAQSLFLELSERALTEDIETAISKVEHLQTLGIAVEIGDFGGSSSLGYLRRLPVKNLKIGRSFISTLGISRSEIPIIRAMIAMANSLNIKVVAEGIEMEDQINNLIELQCDFGQGYLFNRPLDCEAAQKLISEAFSKAWN